MGQKYDVILADQESAFRQAFTEAISFHPMFHLAAVVSNGRDAVRAAKTHRPHVFVLDLVEDASPNAFAVLAALDDGAASQCVIVSAHANEALIARAMACGVQYYIAKPFGMTTLMLRLRQLVDPSAVWQQQRRARCRQRTREEVAQALDALEMPRDFGGFCFLQQAVTLVVEDSTLLKSVTGALYPAVAEQCGSSWPTVERSMRHVIETTWAQGNLTAIHRLFGNSVDRNRGKPTNSAFIARLADHVRMQSRGS